MPWMLEPLHWVAQLFGNSGDSNASTAMSSTTLSDPPPESPEHPTKKLRLSPPQSSAEFSNPSQPNRASSTTKRGSPPRRGFFNSTPRTRIAPQPSATPSLTVPSFSPPTNSLLARVANTANPNSVPNTPAWEAARESVLGQMVTSQDIEIPATVPKAKAKPKTGGRRGRGGGRTTKVKAEPIDTPIALDNSVPVATPSSKRGKGTGKGRGGTRGNRGGRPRGRGGSTRGGGPKRKRNQSDDENAEQDDTDASENYAPLTQSRSGRRITQATTFTPAAVIDLDPPTDMKPPPLKPTTTASTKKPPTKEKEKPTRRKPGEAAVCKNCGRGHSPLSNMIVFCDGCNSPWHQHCHRPPITQDVIRIQEREWFCADCDILRQHQKLWSANISAQRMTLAEKRRYLSTLPPDSLVSLLLHATTIHPSLPIFKAAKPPTQEAVQLVAQVPNQTLEQAAAEEELYDFFAERELLPYPRAGHGVAAKLPPESEDLGMLLDEDV
ncbi:MAG: hypothetical protein Q9195_007942, partial [Heterodermia aff. obscurata]